MALKYKGRNFLAKRGDGAAPEVFTTIGGMRATSLAINNAMIDTTDKQDAPWRTLLAGGIKSMSISLSGNFASDAALRACQSDVLSTVGADIRNWKLIAENLDAFLGNFMIVSMNRDGGYQDEEKYTIKLESSGAIAFTAGP